MDNLSIYKDFEIIRMAKFYNLIELNGVRTYHYKEVTTGNAERLKGTKNFVGEIDCVVGIDCRDSTVKVLTECQSTTLGQFILNALQDAFTRQKPCPAHDVTGVDNEEFIRYETSELTRKYIGHALQGLIVARDAAHSMESIAESACYIGRATADIVLEKEKEKSGDIKKRPNIDC